DRKGCGKQRGFLWANDDTQAFFRSKGKGQGTGQGKQSSVSSGTGFGRRGNPKDAQGNTMRCRVCGSEEHFQRECPKGQGQGKGSSSFGGFVSGQGHQASSPGGQLTMNPRGSVLADTGTHLFIDGPMIEDSPDQAPWDSEDIRPTFSTAYPIFGGDNLEQDPFVLNDPWNNPRASSSSPRMSAPSADHPYAPARTGRRAHSTPPRMMPTTTTATQSRVDDQDELSSSHSQEPGPRGGNIVTQTPLHGMHQQPRAPHGYTTPPVIAPTTYIGMYPERPMEARTGTATLTETQLTSILLTQHASSFTRGEAPSLHRPQMIRHHLPLSTAGS
ncbi:MAG: hypothetical protein GY700_11080, partial [Propionibacteriaceae bacterium]|nr:hypothetical protein [Propionibacteriaceae bacterium]